LPQQQQQSTGGQKRGGGRAAAAQEKLPLQQRVLNGILNVSNVPYSSFVPTPVTPLHRVDARIKQLWLLAIYVLIARATPWLRVFVAGAVAGLTVATLPRRLWEAQLKRLAAICGLIFVFTAIGADGVPPLLQPRALPNAVEALPPLAPEAPYSYVLLNLGGFITVTRRSVNLAITAAALTFCALQSASLCLVTTPGEEMAVALQQWLAPLRILRVPTRRIGVTLLLSLRFMGLVFEEVRNLCLGLAARGVDWRAQGARGSMEVAARLLVRLFGNLFQRSDKIAQAMVVRGFLGPERHHLYMMRVNNTSVLANIAALALLAAFAAAVAALR
jgi:general transcription factor 3C polypeptide 2